MLILAAVLLVLVGVSLGLLGGGGSILAMPVLVHVAGVPVREALALSLVIVGVTSLASTVGHARSGRVVGRVVALFGIAGMVAAPFGASLSERVAPRVLLAAFSVLMLVVGAALLRPRVEGDPSKPRRPIVLMAAGAAVGLLTGFLGVGGGFLIVPALVLLARLPMAQAVGTSLAVITLNSLTAFLSHRQAVHLEMVTAVAFTAAALAGSWLGARWSGRWSPVTLQRAFALVVVTVAIAMGLDSAAAFNSIH